jgi:hypothetical protein
MNKNKKCCLCTYLENYDDNFIREVNNSLFCNFKYNETLKILKSSKIIHELTMPSKYAIQKHGNECLKDFKPIKIKVVQSVVNDNGNNIDNNTSIYTDYNSLNTVQIREELKDKWLHIGCKLTDIIEYRLNNLNHIETNNNINLKDTVSVLKSILDLLYFDSGKDVDDTNNEELKEIAVSFIKPDISTDKDEQIKK